MCYGHDQSSLISWLASEKGASPSLAVQNHLTCDITVEVVVEVKPLVTYVTRVL